MKRANFTRHKGYFSELWRQSAAMKNGWRMGLMLASALLLLMGCTPLW